MASCIGDFRRAVTGRHSIRLSGMRGWRFRQREATDRSFVRTRQETRVRAVPRAKSEATLAADHLRRARQTPGTPSTLHRTRSATSNSLRYRAAFVYLLLILCTLRCDWTTAKMPSFWLSDSQSMFRLHSHPSLRRGVAHTSH